KIRVPIGSSCGLMRTALFSSKRIELPSGRDVSSLTRTTTAFAVSPFFTFVPATASLIETTLTSARRRLRPRGPPKTLPHWARCAPELSATSRIVRIWIMTPSFLHELLDEAHHDEALVARDRAVLLDLDLIADLVLVGLVVRLVPGPVLDVLAVETVAGRRDA